MLSRSVDISELVISKDVPLKTFNKNEPKSILTKSHDFIIGLLFFFSLNVLTKIKYFNGNQKQDCY